MINYDSKIKEYINAKMGILECWMNYIDGEKDSIDVGANFGYISYYMSKYSKTVHCIEPNPVLVEELNKLTTNILNLIIYPYALSDKNGIDILSVPYDNVLKRDNYGIGSLDATWFERMKNRASPNRFGDIKDINVDTKTLDSFNFKNIGCIKIDVEGHERAVLDGAYDTIIRERPTMLIEIWYEPENLRYLRGDIQAIEDIYDYDGFFYDKKSNTLKPALSATTDEANFLFLPR